MRAYDEQGVFDLKKIKFTGKRYEISSLYFENIDEESSQCKIAALITAGISAFIDLTEEGDLYSYAPFLDPYPGGFHHRFEIRDVLIPNAPQTIQILDAIDGHPVRFKTGYRNPI